MKRLLMRLNNKIKEFLETYENEPHNNQKFMGHSKSSPEREVHADTGLPKKIEIFQINNLTLDLQELKEHYKHSPEQVEGNNQDQSRIK